MFRKMLLAYDASDGAKRALEVAIDLAGKYNAELWAVSVNELPSYAAPSPAPIQIVEFQNEFFARELAEAVEAAKRKGIEVKTQILAGHAAQKIVEFAKENSFDLIIAGHVGRSGLWGLLLGSTSERIGHQSCCTVMIVK